MKQVKVIFASAVLSLLFGCETRKTASDDLVLIDLSKDYPKKELLLQDILEVEYIPLETTEDFLTQGLVMEVGKKYLIVKNRNNDGDIFIFDRISGKGIRRFNRLGQGPEEYSMIQDIILDEECSEIFVASPGNRIVVYDYEGKFKRAININQEVTSIFDFDEKNLICYAMTDYHNKGKDRTQAYHLLISKQDGAISKEIFIPFEKINSPIVNEQGQFVASYLSSIRPSHGKWTLFDTSADTIYNYADNGVLEPYIARTPSAHTMNPEVFLSMGISTDRYSFMQTTRAEFNFEKGNGFHGDVLVYDKEDKAVYKAAVYNKDFSSKKFVPMTGISVNREIEYAMILSAHQLIDSHTKGELNEGNLKSIVSKLKEEDNPVVLLVKQKNS